MRGLQSAFRAKTDCRPHLQATYRVLSEMSRKVAWLSRRRQLLHRLPTDPPRNPATRIQLRPTHPLQRVARPDLLAYQILPHLPQSREDARHRRLRPKLASAPKVIHHLIAAHFLQLRPWTRMLQPRTPPIQLPTSSRHRLRRQTPRLQFLQVTIQQSIPTPHVIYSSSGNRLMAQDHRRPVRNAPS